MANDIIGPCVHETSQVVSRSAGPRPIRCYMTPGKQIYDRGSAYQGGWIKPGEAAFGAIPGLSCAMNRVKFHSVDYKPHLVADYLRSREGMRATRQIFTVENPHKCNHCQRNSIEGEALARGQRLFPLDYHLGDAIIAAMSGCALYEWVLSTYKGVESLEEGSDVRFWLRIGPQGLVQVYANNFIRDVGRVELMELDSSALLWAPENHTDLDLDLCLPYERDLGSAESYEFAQTLLQHCLSQHESCRLVETESLTSELLTSLDGQGYATISYCWGGEQHKQLTKAGMNSFKQGVSRLELPQTLQDSIIVTNSLGLNYLWIDALCIIQDDPSDKEYELRRMSEYYSGSTVTICAASASKCSEGFLRVNDDNNFQAGPFHIPLRTWPYWRPLSSVQLFVPAPMPIQPTARRAWTFQESMLSRRLLIYTSRQLYWSCTSFQAGCMGVEVIKSERDALVPGIQPLAFASQSHQTAHHPPRISFLLPEWSAIVGEYAKRELSFPDDKLIAISALAQHFATTFLSSGAEPIYLAGLWKLADNKQFRYQLLWHVANPTPSKRPRIYRAPSWSWASLDAHVSLSDPFGHEEIKFEERYPLSCLVNRYWKAQMHEWESRMSQDVLVDHHIELTSNNVPFGAVKGGFIQVHGAMRKLDPSPAKPERPKRRWYMLRRPKTPPPSFVTPRMSEWPVLRPDTEDDRQIIELALAGQSTVFMLELVPYKPVSSIPEREPETPEGLLLVQTALAIDEYRRVGVFYFRHDKKIQVVERSARDEWDSDGDSDKPKFANQSVETEQRRSTRINFFFGIEPQTIKIF
ncbi:uncharacterized protein PAC_19109 [Phialocephala subalpina]|uniref:Heterokaryon incompatibility domain-containing protein n=1 Tax=Phialocephala subalpina TaxID=576137 RepID=A0A1L7XW42_9HELO|nr:uncharacterized protein PAC_19109 [Phialocephala subalpina]